MRSWGRRARVEGMATKGTKFTEKGGDFEPRMARMSEGRGDGRAHD
jgi:hypothetical protein